MEVHEIDRGIAFCVDMNTYKYIEIHKELKRYPILYKKVMDHEREHYNTDGQFNNIMVDVKDSINIIKHFQLLGFAIKHPSSVMHPILIIQILITTIIITTLVVIL